MNITCEKCNTAYQITDEKIPARGAMANCPNCGSQIVIPAGSRYGKTSGSLVKSESVDFGQTISYDFQEVEQSNTEVSALLKKVSDEQPYLNKGISYYLRDTLTGETYAIDKAQASLGRSDSDINLGDPEVSRGHCTLKIYGENVVVIDMESTNGTYVDGRRMMTANLQIKDIFTVGNTSLQIIALESE